MRRHFRDSRTAADGRALIIDIGKLLKLDSDPEKQASLRRILIEEEDKLASDREQLERAARLTRKGKELIAGGRAQLEQRDLTASAHGNRDFHRTVALMESIQQLYENFHRRLQTKYPYAVKLRDEIVGVCDSLDEARRRAQQFSNANPEAVVTVSHTTLDVREFFFRNANKGQT